MIARLFAIEAAAKGTPPVERIVARCGATANPCRTALFLDATPDRRGEKGAFRHLFTIYFVGSGVSFTVSQFLSARLIFSLSFLRHSVVQYFV
jgi:hypothetical protein